MPRIAGTGKCITFIRASLTAPASPEDPCIVWPFARNVDGYGVLDHEGKQVPAHRLACELRHGKPLPGQVARHGPCNDRGCISHVSWGTTAENMADKRRDRTAPRGVNHHAAKLDEGKVRQILDMLDAGHSQQSVARHFGLATVRHIVSGRCWSDVERSGVVG